MLNSCQRKSAETKRDKVFSFTVIIIIEKRKKTLIWPKNAPRVLGIRLFDCPNFAEKVLESQAESREIFGQLDNSALLGSRSAKQKFWTSARPSVGQSKKICPNADPCSDEWRRHKAKPCNQQYQFWRQSSDSCRLEVTGTTPVGLLLLLQNHRSDRCRSQNR